MNQSDGVGGFVSALFTVTPLSIFAQVSGNCLSSSQFFVDTDLHPQNNGVIALTRCANRSAGRWCCVFLILFGILGKISGVFLASTFYILHSRHYRVIIFIQFQTRFSEVSQRSCSPVLPSLVSASSPMSALRGEIDLF